MSVCHDMYSKLINFYEELNAKFSAATQQFKAGNHLLFFCDMTHKLSDLLFTKGKSPFHTTTLHLCCVSDMTHFTMSDIFYSCESISVKSGT